MLLSIDLNELSEQPAWRASKASDEKYGREMSVDAFAKSLLL